MLPATPQPGISWPTKRRADRPWRIASRLPWAAWAAWVACLLGCLTPPASAQPPLRIRRVLTPPEAQLPAGVRPVLRTEFKSTLELIEASRRRPDHSPAELAGARLLARIDPDRGVAEGFVELDLKALDGEQQMILLQPWNLAVSQAHWTAHQAPARFGADPRGRAALLVEQTGTVRMDWSRRLEPSGGLTLETPYCSPTQIDLEAPAELRPVVTQGVLTRNRREESPESGRWRWLLLTNGGPVQIRLPARDAARQQRLVARQAMEFEATEGALFATTGWTLSGPPSSADAIRVRIQGEAEVIQVTLDGKPLPWTMETDAAESEDEGRWLAVSFPENLAEGEHTLAVRAAAPLTLDQMWRLPTFQLLGAAWRTGQVALRVDPDLRVQDVAALGLGQVEQEFAAGGDRFAWVMDRAAAQLRVRLARRSPALEVISGAHLRWEGRQVTARVKADVESVYGEQFQIELDAPAPWIIDSVAAEPAAALHPADVSLRAEGGRLTLPLRRPLKPNRPIRFIIKAHRPTPRNGALSGLQLRPVRITAAESRELFVMDAELSGLHAVDDFPRLAELSEREKDLLSLDSLPASQEVVVLRDLRNLQRVVASAKAGEARFSAAVSVRVDARRDMIEEAYELRLRPTGGMLERCVVQFSQARPDPPAFWLRTEEGGIRRLTARRLESPEAGEERPADAAGGDAWGPVGFGRGERWEVALPALAASELTVSCRRQTASEATFQCALAALPDADSVAADVRLLVDPRRPMRLETAGLQSSPEPPTEDDVESGSAAYAFTYEPRKAAALTIATQPEPLLEDAWVWRRNAHTRISDSGVLLHRIEYLVESLSRRPLTVTLPRTTALQRLEINGRRLDAAPSSVANRVATPPLPARFVRLTLYCTERPRLRSGPVAMRWKPEVPTIDVRVIDSQWRVTMAPSYTIWRTEQDTQDAAWRQRLFGPLAGWLTESPWNPWAEAAPPRDVLANEFWNLADEALRRDRTTLGAWLGGLASLSRRDLWIDRSAFLLAGLTPQTTLPTRVSNSSRQLCESFGLALTVQENRWVLTSAGVGERFPEHAVAVRRWLAEPPMNSPWPAEADRMALGLATGDGVVLELNNDDPLVILRSTWLAAVAWCALLIGCGAGVMLWWRHSKMPLLIALVALLLAIALPMPAAVFAAAVMWGALLALILGCVRPLAGGGPSPSILSRTALPSALLLLLLCRGDRAAGVQQGSLTQERPAAPAASLNALPAADVEPGVHQVYEVVDAQGRPLTNVVHVPLALKQQLAELRRQAQQEDAWLLTGADYWFDEADGELLARMKLSAWIRRSPGLVRLPWPGEAWELTESSGVLEILPEAGEMLWRPAATGDQSLVLAWRHRKPAADPGDGDPGSADSAAPPPTPVHPTPTARLRLSRAQHAAWQVPSAAAAAAPRGGEQWRESDNHWNIELGAAGEVLPPFRRPDRNRHVTGSSLQWLQVSPGAVSLKTRLQFDCAGEPLRELAVVGDRPLRLQSARLLGEPSGTASTPAAGVELPTPEPASDGAGQRWSWTLPAAVPAATLELEFHVQGEAGIGVVAFPRLEPVCDQAGRRWGAVSAGGETRLAYEDLESTAVAPADFQQHWQAPQPPDAAFQLAASPPEFPVRFRDDAVRCDESLTLLVQADSMEFAYRAELRQVTPTQGPLRLIAPPLRDLRVKVEDRQGNLFARAEANDAGLCVFYRKPRGDSLVLTVSGSLPINISGAARRRLPRIELQGVTPDSSRVDIQRGADVQNVQLSETTGLAVIEEAETSEFQDPDRRLVRRLERQPTRGAWNVAFAAQRNQLQAEGRMLTRLERSGGNWLAELTVLARVKQGVLDSLWLEAPEGWGRTSPEGPLQLVCSPAASVTARRSPHPGRVYLSVTPSEPVAAGDSLRLAVRGLLAADSDVEAPDIAPLNFSAPLRYVSVPRFDAAQRLTWSINGLQAVEGPAVFEAMADEQAGLADHYRVTTSPFRAVQVREENLADVTRVYWAEHRWLWSEDRRELFGVTSLLVDPGDRLALPIQVDQGLTVLSVRVDDQPAAAAPTPQGGWQVQLQSSQAPQRIDVLHRQSVPAGDVLEVARPVVADAPVEATAITISTPQGVAPVIRWPGAETIAPREVRLERWSAALQCWSEAVGRLERRAENVRRRWAANWSEQGELHRRFALASRLTAGEREAARGMQQEQQELAVRLGGGQRQADLENGPLERTAPLYVWSFVDGRPGDSRLRRAGSGADPLSIRLAAQVVQDAFLLRLLTAACIASMVWMLSRVGPWWWVQDAVLRSPFLLLTLLGAAWWLLFQPSPLGWMLIVIGALGAWRFPWPRRFD